MVLRQYAFGCLGLAVILTSCAIPEKVGGSRGPSLVALTVSVEGGPFLMGSTLDERAVAIELDYASLGRATPEVSVWLKKEYRQSTVELAAFRIMRTPVTQGDYLEYMRETGAPEPYVDQATWSQQAVGRPYFEVKKFLWRRGLPRQDREPHPVVLVEQAQASAYCKWWGKRFGLRALLPTEAQWEKAARGVRGQAYPWGPNFDANLLNGAEARNEDTIPVGSYSDAASPYGAQDMAGNVFEWTQTPFEEGSYVVKGGAFSTTGGLARAAARHGRPANLRHITVGFRCVTPAIGKKSKRRGADK